MGVKPDDGIDDRHHPGIGRHGFGIADDCVEGLYRARGKCARRGLPRQHDRVGPFEHGVRRVADFRARWPWLGPHRFEHLGREDQRVGRRTGAREDCPLYPRQLLERHLEAEIPACHHHARRRLEDLVEILTAAGRSIFAMTGTGVRPHS